MKISNVMVSLDRGAAAADRVQLSARLAERFDATLTGVAARQVPALIAVSDVRESERIYEIEDRHAREELAEARLCSCARRRGIRTAWRAALAEPTAYLVAQARAADVIVVGRHGRPTAIPV